MLRRSAYEMIERSRKSFSPIKEETGDLVIEAAIKTGLFNDDKIIFANQNEVKQFCVELISVAKKLQEQHMNEEGEIIMHLQNLEISNTGELTFNLSHILKRKTLGKSINTKYLDCNELSKKEILEYFIMLVTVGYNLESEAYSEVKRIYNEKYKQNVDLRDRYKLLKEIYKDNYIDREWPIPF